MIALATSLLFFLFITIVGIATIQVLRCRFGVLRNWLLAPIAGLAVVVCSVMILNQAGLPVRNFATPLAAGLIIVSSIIVLWRRWPAVPSPLLWCSVARPRGLKGIHLA
jgi:hypothetical protein